ncbi:MAG TPA: BREX-2 system phosphatase PglZ [Streptosporangiaceae bacterium]|nr:BREX-2 system phosphatase PglZ [Streptosporangiaceae bacterium]
MTATRATLPVLRALLDQARRKDYACGVLGVRARPEWTGTPMFTHADVPVRVVPCASALAVREAILERVRDEWLVVLTDRPDDDLGAGILSHLVWQRLRTPDPWDAVRLRFAATGIDPALTGTADDREIAIGLLMAAPASGWPPAPGGVLTRDHALGAVAAVHLGLTDPVIDATSVLAWTTDPAVVIRIADLRALADDGLAGAVLDWAAGRAGTAGRPLLHLLRAGEARDAVPLGLVTGLLAQARNGPADQTRRSTPAPDQPMPEAMQLAGEALIRLEPRLGSAGPADAVLRSWADESAAVLTGMLRDPASRANGETLLARADELLTFSRAESLADGSDLLPAGLTRRLAALARALRAAPALGAHGRPADPDAPQVVGATLAGVEQAWTRVATHRLAEDDPRTPAFHAAVRLVRWLAESSGAAGTSLRSLLDRHGGSDAWVDSAVNDAAPGASDPALGAGLAAVLAAVRARRAAHDVAFAAALAAHTAADPPAASGPHDGVWHLEELLPEVILPLARATPVLLLVLDGLSAGVGTEVMASVLSRTGDGWAEALLAGQSRRAAALAVLPTLTEVSRSSLLCGELRTGGQDVERLGYAALTRAHSLPGAALFHKKPLDSSRLGYAVADDVAAAIADVTGKPLVTCVLNTIDDALDRSDPGGTEWGADAVKHLAPLLDRARHAGRVVILTADHGHIVERRQGTQRPQAAISSGRSRAATEPAADGEVLVTGRRVLLHDGTAVLAVDEHLRYGPLKAGYHGGGAPAEAVVPVAVLVPGAVPDETGLQLAPPQEPGWWIDPVVPVAAVSPLLAPPDSGGRTSRPGVEFRRRTQDAAPTLFDAPDAEPPRSPPGMATRSRPGVATPTPPGTTTPASPAATAVLKSAAYAAQRKIAGRVSVTDDQIRALLDALLAAPGARLVPAAAATALAVSPVTLRGAVLHAQRLLNADGYPVLRVDADGATVILDEGLLREQFGIRG